MKFISLICTFGLLVAAATISQSQQRRDSNFNFSLVQKASAQTIVNPVVTERELAQQFWNWYLTLDNTEKKGVNAFIKAFLLEIKLDPSDADELSIFSTKKSLSLKISGYVEQAEHSEQLHQLLVCVAFDGGSECDPLKR